uniref:Uncharacterized protein n=1 Tax=Anopheles merus TaxID=30066 RepID=A0A182VJU9_ANOME
MKKKTGLCHLGEIEINYNVHSLYVDTTSEEIGADQVPAQPRPEVVEHPVPVGLLHAGVDVVAAVAQLGNLFREQFDTLRRIAEDDRLVDLELREERVKTVHLLALLHEGVVLRDALQRQLLHQVDLVRIAQMLLHEVLHAQLVPPVVTMTRMFMCFASSMQICDVCRASSRVGTMISA